MIFEPVVRLEQTVHLSCTNTNNISKQIETRFHMTHVTKEFHLVHPKLFPSLHSVQTVQLSCTNTNTISKQIETRFHMTHVT